MNSLDYMKATWEEWSYRRVRIVAIPLPPIAIKGLIYSPDCFQSDTFDNTYDCKDNIRGRDTTCYRSIDIVPSKIGPAILISIRLKDLVGFDARLGTLNVQRDAICASVTYQTKYDLATGKDIPERKLDYAYAVKLEALNFQRSCNPGSHLVVPNAPYTSAILQYAASPQATENENSKIIKDLHFVSPDEARALFPEFDFSANIEIDQYIATCAVQPEVKYYHRSTGVGPWVVPYLQKLRLNRISMEEPGYVEKRLTSTNRPSEEDGRLVGYDPYRG